MRFKLYTILDRTAEQYGPVFQAINDGVASRQFIQLMSKVVPWDRDAFRLHFVAEFDDSSGLVYGEPVVVFVDVNMPTLPKESDDE